MIFCGVVINIIYKIIIPVDNFIITCGKSQFKFYPMTDINNFVLMNYWNFYPQVNWKIVDNFQYSIENGLRSKNVEI